MKNLLFEADVCFYGIEAAASAMRPSLIAVHLHMRKGKGELIISQNYFFLLCPGWHEAGSGRDWPAQVHGLISRRSHARPSRISRPIMGMERPSAAAVSSKLKPPK